MELPHVLCVFSFRAAQRFHDIQLPQPLGELAEQQLGATPIADFDQGSLQNFPFTGYIGTARWVKSRPLTRE